MSKPAFNVIVRNQRDVATVIGRAWFHDRSQDGKKSFFSGRLSAVPQRGVSILVPVAEDQVPLALSEERWSICRQLRAGDREFWQHYGTGTYQAPSNAGGEELPMEWDCVPVGALSHDSSEVVAEFTMFPHAPRGA